MIEKIKKKILNRKFILYGVFGVITFIENIFSVFGSMWNRL